MTGFVHDPRHRFSYEVRPGADLDATLRALACNLERRGLIEAGASTAARFQPHVTLLRAATAPPAAVEAAAAVVRARPQVVLDRAGSFGNGRIVYLQMRARAQLDAARARAVSIIAPEHLDPLVHARDWTPHVTIAYAVPELAREEALRAVEDALPIRGAWQWVQAWDLDVRPTRLVAQVDVSAAPAGDSMA